MDIGNALRKAGRDDITMRSIIANTTLQLAKDKLSKDITIESVQILWKKIRIKTWSTLINSELQFISTDIKKNSQEKLKKMWIYLSEDTQFIFN